MGHPTPYLQERQSIQVPSSTKSPVERTEEDCPRIAPVVPRQQRNELKKNILVSSQWKLRYRAGVESEIRAQTLVSETRSDSAESRRCRFPWASALCRTCSSCIYIESAITPRVTTARYLILLANKAQGPLLYIIFIIGCIGYRKGTTSGDNDRPCI